MQLIQIAGLGRSGKTTLASLIAKQLFNIGYIPIILPFAKSLKNMADALGYSKTTQPSKYREFCQQLGYEKRKEDPDYWIKLSIKEIEIYSNKELLSKQPNQQPKKYIIIQDDVRYMNELALGKGINSFRIFISSGARIIEDENSSWRNHESEELNTILNYQLMSSYFGTDVVSNNVELSELFNVIVLNDKTEEYLEAKVDKYLTSWLEVTNHINNTSLQKELKNEETKQSIT